MTSASPDEMSEWALRYVAEHPDDPLDPARGFTVYQGGRPYLRRWYVVPRNDVRNVYLHQFLLSDDDRALHDHRGDNTSFLIDGDYVEYVLPRSRYDSGVRTPDVRRVRAGETATRRATDLHRVELVDGRPVLSLFFIGPTVRDWGFGCERGWVPWRDFVEVVPGGNAVGRGCGD